MKLWLKNGKLQHTYIVCRGTSWIVCDVLLLKTTIRDKFPLQLVWIVGTMAYIVNQKRTDTSRCCASKALDTWVIVKDYSVHSKCIPTYFMH